MKVESAAGESAAGVIRVPRPGGGFSGRAVCPAGASWDRGHAMLYAMIAVMVLAWSVNYVMAKLALREFPPALLSTLRMTVAGSAMLPIYWWDRRRTSDRLERGDLPLLFGLGILGVALNQIFFVVGLSRTSVAHAAIINGTAPITVLLLAALRGQEHITLRKAVGMAVALGGVALLKLLETAPSGSGGPTWTGDLCVFLGSFAFALFTVFGKTATLRHSSITVNAFAYAGSAAAVSPITVWLAWDFPFASVTWAAWGGLLFMALVASVLCYLIYYYALTHMMPSRVSAFSYLQPPLVAVFGILTLGEHITAALVFSALVIFSGVFLTERG